MAQVSYGTITITDTTDIERIYPVYCKGGETVAPSLQPLSNWSETVSQAGGTGDYIWQRIVAKKQNIAVTVADYSDAVRLTGDSGVSLTISSTQYAQTQNETDTPSYGNSMPSPINEGWWLWVKVNYSDGNSTVTKIKQGQKGDIGISVTGTKEIYFLKRTTDNIPTAPGDGVNTTSTSTAGGVWTTVVPDYVTGSVYYTSIQTSYSSGTSPKSSPAVINQGLTDANAKALDAYNTSTARDTEINAIKAQAKHYWWDSQGAHVAAGENTTSVDNITQGTPSTYGFNSLMAPGYLALKYKDINFAQLATNSLTFYRPATNGSTYVQGKKGMDLTVDALTFYKPLAYNSSSEPTAAATLDSNGLVLSEGGIKSGDVNAGNSGFVYLSTKNYGSNLTINGHQASNWREVIGTKFGVDADGNLYASNANISGKITVSSGSDLSAGLGDYSTTSQTQQYVTGLGYQTSSQVSTAVSNGISNASVSDLSDGSSYSTTSQMNTAIGNATNDMATQTYVLNNYATQNALNTETNQRKAQYGTSSTSASTRAKVVICSDFELVAGNEITVKFSTANTYTSNSVQLNVNNKGAKDVWVANTITSSTNQLLWGANAYITFRYDGTQFIVIGEPRTWYGASTTAAGTAAKTDTTAVTGCVICKGAKIELAMSENNTSTSATLNIQSTGAKNIYYGNTTTRPTVDNGHSWLGVSTATFTFDGAYYRMAGQTVIDGDNIKTGTIDANRITASVITAVNSSTETSGGSSLKISADKVNIEGAAIFTSGRLSTSSLNSTIDERIPDIPDDLSDLTDTTGKIPDVSETIISATTLYYASNSTTAPAKPTSHISTNSTSTRGQWNIALPTYNESYPYLYICTEYKTKGNTYSWTSVEQTSYSSAISAIKTNTDAAIKSQVNLYYASNNTTAPNKPTAHITTNSTSTYGQWNIALPTYSDTYPYLYTCKETLTNGGTYAWTSVEQSTYAAATAAIKTTADAAAPKSDAIAEEQRIYYRSNISTKPNGNGLPTSWVTETGNKYNTNATTSTGWSRKITPIANDTGSSVTKYLYLWTCIQKKTVSGTVTYGDILLDDSTTVIDGGNIITGTVTANQLNATSINASNVLTIGAFTDATQSSISNSELSDDITNAAKTASNYLGDTDSNAGVTLKAQNGTTTANTSTSNYIKINSSGLEIFKAGVSIASYGDTARIGKSNNAAFHIESNKLQAYYMNGSTRTLYFEVSPTGIKYGPSLNTTVATTSQIPTTVASLSDANDYATKINAQDYANTAEANASYSVEIQVTAIDYVNNSATLVAIPYYQGSTTIPSGTTLSYRWYKNGTALSNTSTAPTISGATTATLTLGQGTDFGSSTTNAIYTCVIS